MVLLQLAAAHGSAEGVGGLPREPRYDLVRALVEKVGDRHLAVVQLLDLVGKTQLRRQLELGTKLQVRTQLERRVEVLEAVAVLAVLVLEAVAAVAVLRLEAVAAVAVLLPMRLLRRIEVSAIGRRLGR